MTAGLAIYHTIQHVPCDVSTVCMGLAVSMGQFLLCGGEFDENRPRTCQVTPRLATASLASDPARTLSRVPGCAGDVTEASGRPSGRFVAQGWAVLGEADRRGKSPIGRSACARGFPIQHNDRHQFIGFLYWFAAARMVPARGVGIASAIQLIAQFLSIFCVLGLSTLLIGELARDRY